MAGFLSNYRINKILDHLYGKTTYTAEATTYFALMTAAPTASGGGTEVSGGSYARVAFTNNTSNWPAASGQVKQNGNVVDWGTATANWGTIVGIAEYDASSGGNLLSYAPLTTSRAVNNGESFSGPVGAGTYTLQ